MAATGQIHYAKIDKSARLQRLRDFLADGKEHSTLDIIHGANIAAVSAAVTELRENGFKVACRKVEANRFMYQMKKEKEV